jgi:hypothetical protein
MSMLLLRGVIAGLIVVGVSLLAKAQPRLGAFLLTLPIVSIVAFVSVWYQQHDLPAVSRLARETLILVPLGLPFFVPLAFAGRLGIGFASAFGLGLVLASITVGLWLWLGPQQV